MTGVSTVQELPIQEEVDIVHVRQAAREVAVSVGFLGRSDQGGDSGEELPGTHCSTAVAVWPRSDWSVRRTTRHCSWCSGMTDPASRTWSRP